jgi:hypothetical protein
MLGSFGLVVPRITPAHERDGQLRGVLCLPAADIRQQRVAGAAVRIGEKEQYRLAGGAQGLER